MAWAVAATTAMHSNMECCYRLVCGNAGCAGAGLQVFTPCTLKELCPEDKQKVAQLVKQVVELGKENQQLKAAAATVSECSMH